MLEEPLCNISTGQPGKKKFSLRPDGVRKNHVSPGHGETGDRKRSRHKSQKVRPPQTHILTEFQHIPSGGLVTMRTEIFPRPPVERGYGRLRTPELPTTVSVTPAPDRSEIRRFRKFLRFLLPFGNQAHTRAKNRRTPSQGCLLGWLSLTWTPRFNKTNVRTVRSLGIDIFSKRPKVPVSLLLT